MERIKAVYVPVVGEDKEATIIDLVLYSGEAEEENYRNDMIYEALWVDNDGIFHHHPITEFKVDMDSFTGRKDKQKISTLVEMLYHAFIAAKE